MLKKLRIQRFKSIHDETVEFGCANIFIGPNGAGKSNVLEAIGILSSALARGLEPRDLDYKGIRLSVPALFKSSFKNRDLPKTFRLEAVFDTFSYDVSISASDQSSTLQFQTESLSADGERVFGRSPHGFSFESTLGSLDRESRQLLGISPHRSVFNEYEHVIDIPPSVLQEISEFSQYAIYAPQTAVMRGMATDNRVIAPLGLTGSRLAKAFEECLIHWRQPKTDDHHRLYNAFKAVAWLPGWADQIKIGKRNEDVVPGHVMTEADVLYFRDRFMKTTRNMLSPYDASEGALYLLFIGVLLSHPESPSSFAVDNIDGTLNPGLVKVMLEAVVDDAMKSRTRQFFATSHHPSALDAFDIFDDHQAVFVVQRASNADAKQEGETAIRRLRPPKGYTKEQWVRRAEGKNLSELYLREQIVGALG